MQKLHQARDVELEQIRSAHESMSDEKLTKALQRTLRNMDYVDINKRMSDLMLRFTNSEIPADRVDYESLQIYRRVLAAAYTASIEQISAGLERISARLPANPYNIQECLITFATQLDPFVPFSSEKASVLALTEVDLNRDYEAPIYNTADQEAEYSRGFEEGYQRALDNMKDSSKSEVISQLDIE